MSSIIRRAFTQSNKTVLSRSMTLSAAKIFSTTMNTTSKFGSMISKLRSSKAAVVTTAATVPTVTDTSGSNTDYSSMKDLSEALSASAGNSMLADIPTSVLDAATAASIVPAVEHNPFTQFTIDLMTNMHSMGLPWWACIVAFGVGLRLAVLPVYLKQLASGSRTRFAMAVTGPPPVPSAALTIEERQMQTMQLFKVYKYFDSSPIKAMAYALITMPPTVYGFLTLKGFLEDPAFAETLSQGGIEPWANLAVADPTYTLPTLAAASTLVVMLDAFRAQKQTAQTKLLGKIFAGATVASIWFVSGFPVGFFYYWITANFMTLLSGRFARSDFWAHKSNSPTQRQIRVIEANPELAAGFKTAMDMGLPLTNWSKPSEQAIRANQDRLARENIKFHEATQFDKIPSVSEAIAATSSPASATKTPSIAPETQSEPKKARRKGGIPKNFRR